MDDDLDRIRYQLKLEGYRGIWISSIPVTNEVLIDIPASRGSIRISAHILRNKTPADAVHVIREEIKIAKLLGVFYND